MSHTALTPQKVSSSKSDNIIRVALAFESVLTVIISGYYVFFPRHYLLHIMGAAPAQVTTTALQSTQQYRAVGILIGAGVALLVFELLLIPLLLWQAFMIDGNIWRHSLLATAGQFVIFVIWRLFVLGRKPEWFGCSQEGRRSE